MEEMERGREGGKAYPVVKSRFEIGCKVLRRDPFAVSNI